MKEKIIDIKHCLPPSEHERLKTAKRNGYHIHLKRMFRIIYLDKFGKKQEAWFEELSAVPEELLNSYYAGH